MSNKGKQVKVHYTATLEDGTVVDSSYERDEPLDFFCMTGEMIPGFDAAVETMTEGETKKVHVPAAQAYGEHRDDLVQKLPVMYFPYADQLSAGQEISIPRGEMLPPFKAIVSAVDKDFITVDTNHKLAGKDIDFEITLIKVYD